MDMKFRRAGGFGLYFRQHSIGVLLLLGFVVGAIICSTFVPNPFAIIFGLFFTFAFFIGCIGLGVGFIFNLNIISFKDGMIKLPPSGYNMAFFPGFNSEGYYVDSPRKVLFVSSSFKNVVDVWKVTSPKEIGDIKHNRVLYNAYVTMSVGGLNVRVTDIPRMMGDLREGKNMFKKVVEKLCQYNYVIDPKKTVGIKFKELGTFRGKDNFIGHVSDALMKLYPVLRNQVVYVSVKDPDKLVREIKKRMKK